ncbi:MAG TPA: uracil-DNA glycosylase family protein, partial [Pyrinomonadaceae bacterium]|nr:uracil-DNA glycosylase family protein [Pyrinomonadaceae bacterium]
MRSDLEQVLKPRALNKYRDTSEVLKAPLSALSILSESQVRRLRAAKIATVGDLVADRDNLKSSRDLPQALLISADLWDILFCALFGSPSDAGPTCAWAPLFGRAPLDYYINLSNHPFHTRFGPVFYRGRLDGTARVLVIGQDPATDETLAQRVFVGQAGQIAQNYLTRLGLTRSYLMFNTFLFGGQSGSLTQELATDPTIMAYRNRLFDKAKATCPLVCILAFGAYAQTSADNWPGRGSLPVIKLTHPTAPSGVAANWNTRYAAAQSAIVTPDSGGAFDPTPYSTTGPMPTTDVPRRDLPFGLPTWHGTGGVTRSQRVSGSFET